MFRAAWELISVLCAGGNSQVQDIVCQELDGNPESKCLIYLRDFLNDTFDALRKHVVRRLGHLRACCRLKM